MRNNSISDCIDDLRQISERLNTIRGNEIPQLIDQELLACVRKIRTPVEKRLVEKKKRGNVSQP